MFLWIASNKRKTINLEFINFQKAHNSILTNYP